MDVTQIPAVAEPYGVLVALVGVGIYLVRFSTQKLADNFTLVFNDMKAQRELEKEERDRERAVNDARYRSWEIARETFLAQERECQSAVSELRMKVAVLETQQGYLLQRQAALPNPEPSDVREYPPSTR